MLVAKYIITPGEEKGLTAVDEAALSVAITTKLGPMCPGLIHT